MKLFLIDAYALIYRSYYAFIRSPFYNSKGENTSAVFGFVRALEDVIEKEKPTHIAVAFDPKGKTFRHEIYPEYKANRDATPEDIHKAVPIIKEILEAYKIPIIEQPGYEADDVIGTLANKAAPQGFDVFMMTPDKDYAQLVSKNIYMYRPKHTGGYEILDEEKILEKYKLNSTDQIIDLLALMGDASDNIPGCPGVGPKTAQKLLATYNNIESLLKNKDELKGAVKKKINENIEQIKFSKYLVTIKKDVPLSINFEDTKLSEPDQKALRVLFSKLEFTTFLKKLDQSPANISEEQEKQPEMLDLFAYQNTETPKYQNLRDLNTVKKDYQLIDNQEDTSKLEALLNKQKIFAFDTETDSLDVINAKLVGISFSIEENSGYYVPIDEDVLKAKEILKHFKPALENPNITKIGQNIKFDINVLRNYDIKVKGRLFDTMIAHYLLEPDLPHNMDYLAEVYLKHKTIHIEELIGEKGKGQKSMREVEINKIKDYAAEDADITLRLKNHLYPLLKEYNLWDLFTEIEMPLIYVLADMEYTGVKVDVSALKETQQFVTTKMLQKQKEIYALANSEFNINSSKQVGEILFDRLKISDKVKKTKTGNYSTNEETLQKLKNNHPIVEKILEYRGLKKLLSTYIEALPKLINKKTGKIHTSYNQAVTSTGRLSSTNPNLQNIPIREEMGKEIRKAFVSDNSDCTFFSADYSQIELRIMAHLSQDEHMLDAFKKGIDIHAATAAKIYNVNIDNVTSDMRRKAKTANFGIIYGISVFGLSQRLNIPRSEAKELIDGYFNTYQRVKSYMDEMISSAREKGYIETLFKRRRYLPDIQSQNAMVRGYAERNAINAPIQGCAADIIKIAMSRIFKRFEEANLKSKMILQVHDELNFNVYKEELEEVRKIVLEEMEGAVSLSVSLIVDCGEGKNWLVAH